MVYWPYSNKISAKFQEKQCVWIGTLWLSHAYDHILETVFSESKTKNSKL